MEIGFAWHIDLDGVYKRVSRICYSSSLAQVVHGLNSDVLRGRILRKLGGRYQPIIENPTDVWDVLSVEHQHWSANCAPIDGLSCDAQFLRFLDGDENGRILPVEVCSALRWLKEALNHSESIWNSSDALPLSAFQTETALGRDLRDSAEHVLQTLEISEPVLTLEHVRARTLILQAAEMNGDGVMPPSAFQDPTMQKTISDIVAVMGGVEDLNGELGVNLEQLNRFPELVSAWLAWSSQVPETHFDNPKKSVAAIQHSADGRF